MAALEGLRGLAIVLVFFVHYHTLFASYVSADPVSHAISAFAGVIGHCGVDLFFVLSGFLIYGMVLRTRMPYRQFMRRRVERLYPTFVTVFAAYVVLSYAFPGENKIPSQPIPAFWYLVENAALLPGLIDVTPLITVSWSLSYEFVFYATVPLVVYGLSLDSWSSTSRVRLLVIVGVVSVALFIAGPLPQLRASMFIVGMLLHEALSSSRFKARLSARGERLVIVLFPATFPVIYFLFRRSVASGADDMTWSAPAMAVLWCSFSALVVYAAGFDGGLPNSVHGAAAAAGDRQLLLLPGARPHVESDRARRSPLRAAAGSGDDAVLVHAARGVSHVRGRRHRAVLRGRAADVSESAGVTTLHRDERLPCPPTGSVCSIVQ